MAWADLLLPEAALAAMLAECQTWRAIVASPAAVWSEIAATMDGGAVAEGDAAAKVVTSLFAEREDAAAHLDLPRAVVSHQEGDTFTRESTSGATLSGRLFLMIETPVPPSIEDDAAAVKDDVRRKALAVMVNLFGLGRAYPRLDLESAEIESGVIYPSENNGEAFGIIQGSLTYRGAV